MDNFQLSDLASIMSKLSENPAALSALSGLFGSMGAQKPSPPTQSPTSNPQSPFDSDSLSSLMNLAMGMQHGQRGAAQFNSGAPSFNDSPRHDGKNQLSPHLSSNPFGSPDEIKTRIMLLNAVRPYLNESRREKLEAVIKLLKLAELGGLASLLGSN